MPSTSNDELWDLVAPSEINQHLSGQLIYDKGGKNINGIKSVFSMNSFGKTGQIHEKIKLDHFLIPYTK